MTGDVPGDVPGAGAFCEEGCDAYCAMRYLADRLERLGITADVEDLNDDDVHLYLSAKDAAGLGHALDDVLSCCAAGFPAMDDDPAQCP